MGNFLQELGIGMAGLGQGLNQWATNRYKNQLLNLQMQQQARQDKMTADALRMHELDYQLKKREADQSEAGNTLLAAVFGGAMGGGNVPASPVSVPSQGPNLTGGPTQVSPKLGELSDLVKWTAGYYGINPDTWSKLIHSESYDKNLGSINPNAVSPKGAQGLSQLMPDTARSMGVENPFDPYQNLMGGAKYFKQQLDRYGGDERKAAWAYNAGPGNADKGVLPKETQTYLGRIFGQNQTPQGVQVADSGGGSVVDAGNPAPNVNPNQTIPLGGRNYSITQIRNSPETMNVLGVMASGMYGKANAEKAKGILQVIDTSLKLQEHEDPDTKRAKDNAASLEKEAILAENKQLREAPQQYFTNASKLRNDFESNADVKVFNTLGQAYANIKSALKTPGREGDIALTYALMKIFDPNSVVRESEYAMAAGGRGAQEAATGAIQRVMGGGSLLPEERAQFAKVVENMITAQQGRYEEKKKFYSDFAQRSGIDPGHVIVPSDPNNSYAPSIASDVMAPAHPPSKQDTRPPLREFKKSSSAQPPSWANGLAEVQ